MRWLIAGLGLTAALAAPASDSARTVEADIAAYTKWLRLEWPELLYKSANPELLLVGALLTQAPTNLEHAPEEFFSRALDGDPDNVLILLDAANFCLLKQTSPFCNQPILSRLSALDSENGAVWAMHALERRARSYSPVNGVLDALPPDDPFWQKFFAAFITEGEFAAQKLAAEKAADQYRKSLSGGR